MDNVTHALSGLLVAELAVRASARGDSPAPRWRDAAFLSSVLAQNVPDLDLLLTGLTGGRIGYLVHHRGHTHTLVMALPLALLAMTPAWAWMRARRLALGRDWGRVFGLCLLGTVMHLALDATNEYGVHPFWPLDARWYYGDSVFIVEPLLWASAIPALIFGLRTRVARLLLGALLAAILAAAILARGYVRVEAALALLAFTALMFALARRRPWVGALAWSTVTLVFALGASRAASLARTLAPGEQVEDVVVSPLPADPLCYRALIVSIDGPRYRVRAARIAPLPSVVAAERCPDMSGHPTAPVRPIERTPRDPRVAWGAELELELGELGELARRCDVGAFLRFARVPYWERLPAGLRVGDLRYDRERELGFAELDLPERVGDCPPRVPDWRPPREALLAP